MAPVAPVTRACRGRPGCAWTRAISVSKLSSRAEIVRQRYPEPCENSRAQIESLFALLTRRAPLAQLDRATDYESVTYAPLPVTRPYEAYMGTLALPRLVTDTARDHSLASQNQAKRRAPLLRVAQRAMIWRDSLDPAQGIEKVLRCWKFGRCPAPPLEKTSDAPRRP